MGLLGILLGLALLVWLAYRRRVRRRANTRLLDANFHGQRVAICRAIFSVVPAWGPVWQADGGQWFRRGDCRFHDETVGTAARDTHGRTGRRPGHLRRCQPV